MQISLFYRIPAGAFLLKKARIYRKIICMADENRKFLKKHGQGLYVYSLKDILAKREYIRESG